jgi:hypothetical protein
MEVLEIGLLLRPELAALNGMIVESVRKSRDYAEADFSGFYGLLIGTLSTFGVAFCLNTKAAIQ